ncbi:hypothetical protein PV10_02722 [Exophiala mesophila]|uniref:Inner centromere protein ARK-binding domain-containing protein n=1 Tax=Exophiala mesophila TaxID=212818 RepID=A0A0D1ZM65_EXOME|nr:uncharacterized protein PV10_02722 [Exophiala mesophila]KIV95014.1 hypothetical protein PV10_02722 [Exophiala mesophila]
MAARATAVGSPAWIAAEKENALDALHKEKEEVIFPAQHQIEWLNEHMNEIFSQSNLDIGNVFKTPGKLRGKTPRTARKRNLPDARIPLSDLFSSKPIPQYSPHRSPSPKKPHFTVALDPLVQAQTAFKSQTDSGYQGSSQSTDSFTQQLHWTSNPPEQTPTSNLADVVLQDDIAESHELRTTEGSFHSAKEDQTTKVLTTESGRKDSIPTQEQSQESVSGPQQTVDTQQDFDDELGSPSDESTPDRPLVRKSSLTFAALPAREPMKTSIGARISRTSHLDASRSGHNHPYNLKQSLPVTQDDQDTTMRDDEDDENVEVLGYDESDEENEEAKAQSKSSTQRLHEKIDMLGKAPAPRPSKSIPSGLTNSKMSEAADSAYGSLKNKYAMTDDDDDWIKPLTSQNPISSPAKSTATREEIDSDSEDEFDLRAPELIAHEERMRTPAGMSPSPGRIRPGYGHVKSASTATLASPAKASMAPPASPAKSISVSNPTHQPTTTPQGSPRRYMDLSASKSRLQSIMKTAKGLFTTSASVSAAAKLETLSPNAIKVAASAMPGMYPNLNGLLDSKPLPPQPIEPRRTRGSLEREKKEQRAEREAELRQRMDDRLEKARDNERKKAADQKLAQDKIAPSKATEQPAQSSPKRAGEDQTHQETLEPSTQGLKSGRPIRPVRDPPVNKAKPAPVSIRVGTLSQRMPISGAPSNQESLPVEPKRPGLAKKASTTSLQSATATGFKTSVHGQPPKPRALLAAERKKEQDEREAQRKLEAKRELERKRAAQQEQARKEEQRQRMEAEKKERERVAAEQAKRQAQQQAIERKRQEAARKAEQQRAEREAASSRPASRLGTQAGNRSLINHPLPTNPVKPAKRPLEEEAGAARVPNKGENGKRRKTEEDSMVENAPRPVVSGAPIRQSQLGKKASIFNHGTYGPAPTTSHMGQFPQPPTRAAPPQMQQFGTGAKIPFADAANPPVPVKTPIAMMQQKTIHTVKSSPQYVNGEAIHLPEIPTDSEDEDSDDDGNAFPIPDWATPGHLTEQLIRQEAMDGDAVFGPIGPLKMEEIFAKGNKERLKRLRDRTSSANWAMSGDGLTLEEVRADREQRERMRREGGWRYGNH